MLTFREALRYPWTGAASELVVTATTFLILAFAHELHHVLPVAVASVRDNTLVYYYLTAFWFTDLLLPFQSTCLSAFADSVYGMNRNYGKAVNLIPMHCRLSLPFTCNCNYARPRALWTWRNNFHKVAYLTLISLMAKTCVLFNVLNQSANTRNAQ